MNTATAKRSEAKERQAALWPVQLVMLLGTATFGVGNMVIPSVRAGFGVGGGEAALLLGCFTASFASALLPGARWGDDRGRRLVLIIGLVTAAVAGVASVVAPAIGVLVAARSIQGVGFGLALPQVLGTVQASSTGARRARHIVLYSAMGGVGGALGLVAGGLLISAAGSAGWRWALGLIVALTVVALAGSWRISETRAPGRHRTDAAGVVLSAAALLLLVTGLTLGSAGGWQPWHVGLAGLGVVAALVFVRVELRRERLGRSALIPPSVFSQLPLRYGVLMTGFFFAGYGAYMYNFTQITQRSLGLPAWLTGVSLLGFAGSFLVASLLSPRIQRRWGDFTMERAGLMNVAAVLLIILAGVLSMTGAPALWVLWVQLPALLLGVAQAWVFAPLVATIMRQIPTRLAGLTGGLISVTQQAALALAVATIGGVYLVLSDSVDARWAFCAAMVLHAACAVAFVLLAVRLRRITHTV